MKFAKCPLCDKEFNIIDSSLSFKVKVWEINGKKVELSCYTVDCPECGKELVFKTPISARAAAGNEVYYKELSAAVDNFIKSNSNILNIGFHDL